ncbi:thermonuclease family protein [Candidatus Gottesmanbacteria bacterium]|nr:thermonuclease family protein [Candidatus Gottesmanbacteria bacterium]
MKKLPILAIGFILALLGNVFFTINAYERTRVVSVPDGDSLELKDGRRIRLLGIDAPERGRCMADEARSKLVDLAQGRHVRLKEIVKDDYGRQLAIVIVDGVPLQRALLAAGLARNRSAVSNPYHQVLKDAQEVAKAAKRGIWSDTCRGVSSEKEECTIKGNTRAGKKQYYTPDCPTYDQVIVDTAFGDAWFCSEKEAVNAGFEKASSCR